MFLLCLSSPTIVLFTLTPLSGRRRFGRSCRRGDTTRNLIRVWVHKYEEGAFDDDGEAADLIQEY